MRLTPWRIASSRRIGSMTPASSTRERWGDRQGARSLSRGPAGVGGLGGDPREARGQHGAGSGTRRPFAPSTWVNPRAPDLPRCGRRGRRGFRLDTSPARTRKRARANAYPLGITSTARGGLRRLGLCSQPALVAGSFVVPSAGSGIKPRPTETAASVKCVWTISRDGASERAPAVTQGFVGWRRPEPS